MDTRQEVGSWPVAQRVVRRSTPLSISNNSLMFVLRPSNTSCAMFMIRCLACISASCPYLADSGRAVATPLLPAFATALADSGGRGSVQWLLVRRRSSANMYQGQYARIARCYTLMLEVFYGCRGTKRNAGFSG